MIHLFDLDRAAFAQRAADASRRRDHAASLATLEVLDATNGLSRGAAQRLWSELLAVQRWEEALRLLEDHRFSMKADAAYWYDLACARAAARPLATARAALDKTLTLEPKHPEARKLAAALDRLEAYGSTAQGIGDCAGLTDLVDLLIDLHRYRDAATHLGSFLVRRRIPLSCEEQDLAADRARTLFRVADPVCTLILLLGLRSAFTARGLDDVFEWAIEDLTAPVDSAARARPDFGHHLGLQVCLAQAFAAYGKWKTAVALFGPAATLPDDPFDCRLELARCVGRAVAEEVQPVFTGSSGRPKVVDVFPFFDELLLLELKLEEMSPWVDRFVLLEASTTFTGASKALVYEQNKARFAAHADKIIHHVVDFPEWTDTPWAREFYQRDAALATLAGICGPEDLVLVSDADEIIAKAAIDRFDGEYATLGMPLYAYFFNLRLRKSGQGTYGGVCRAKYFDRIGLSLARMGLRRYSRRDRLSDGGWHFTSIKSAGELLAKLRAFSHVEHSKVKPEALAELLEDIKREGGPAGCERCDIDESMPRALRDNLERVSGFIL